MHMEGGILADAEVVDSLALQVLLHDFPLRSNPLVLFGLRLRHGKNAYGLNEDAQRCAAKGSGLKPRRDRRIRCSKS
jgi:hypothetical protein